MKKIYGNLFLLAIAALTLITGCQDDEGLNNTQVTPVGSLYAPDDNAYLFLEGSSSALFEWEAAKAEDNGVVLYEVVFDKEDGDFSNPVYKIASDGNGLKRFLTFPFADLNRVAGMAGIERGGIGKLKWTVYSSKGINVQESAVDRIIEVERPAGFIAPNQLYLTGTATEGGENLADALEMKKVGDNVFEIYTSLKAGEYYFATGTEGTPETFFIEDGKLKAEGKTAYAGEETVYRIKVDFSTATTEMTAIGPVELWFSPNNTTLFELPYAGNGTWEILSAPIEFKQEDWGRDERYKFRFTTINADGSTAEEWYGSVNNDNQRPTESTDASYWYMLPVSNDQWANAFKFADAVDNNESDIKIIFNTSVPEYTHVVTPH